MAAEREKKYLTYGIQLENVGDLLVKERNTRKYGENSALLTNAYRAMMERCYNANHKSNMYYTHVVVCDEWLNSRKSFNEWAFANGFKPGLQLDRIDSNGIYCPENCQWLTPKEHGKKTNDKRWHLHRAEKLKNSDKLL
jgi:hypothetical protein